MERVTKKRIVLASLVMFGLSSAIPMAIGDLHKATMQFGLPPWLGVDVVYGMPTSQGGFIVHGPIDHIGAWHLDYLMLPLAMGVALAGGSLAIGVLKGLAMAAGLPKGAR